MDSAKPMLGEWEPADRERSFGIPRTRAIGGARTSPTTDGGRSGTRAEWRPSFTVALPTSPPPNSPPTQPRASSTNYPKMPPRCRRGVGVTGGGVRVEGAVQALWCSLPGYLVIRFGDDGWFRAPTWDGAFEGQRVEVIVRALPDAKGGA